MANCKYCETECSGKGKNQLVKCDFWDSTATATILESEQVDIKVETGTTETAKGMTRQELSVAVSGYCDGIKDLFNYKNQDYGQGNDAFANFRKTAQRVIIPFMQKHGVDVDEHDAMFLVLMVYQDKHLVALSQTGLGGNEVAERLGDVANYALIAKGLLADKEAVK